MNKRNNIINNWKKNNRKKILWIKETTLSITETRSKNETTISQQNNRSTKNISKSSMKDKKI